MASLGTKCVCIANFLPEIYECTLRAHLAPYGEIHTVQEEKWSNVYRYTVANGIHIVNITLIKNIPSYLTIVGHHVLVSYDEQPQTRYGCGDMGHLYQACPKRKTRRDSVETRRHKRGLT